MSNAYDVVRQFESAVAEYTGAPYAVAVESCSAALFLCCLYCKVKDIPEIIVPSITYPSVPCSVINAGGRVVFVDADWQGQGIYCLAPTPIIDSAKRIYKKMYEDFPGKLICLSFHGKKHIKIGRGGMILTDSKEAYETFKWMRFDGRHECALDKDTLQGVGWNCYMSPEQAARGLEQLQWIGDGGVLLPDQYQDLSKYKFFTEANR